VTFGWPSRHCSLQTFQHAWIACNFQGWLLAQVCKLQPSTSSHRQPRQTTHCDMPNSCPTHMLPSIGAVLCVQRIHLSEPPTSSAGHSRHSELVRRQPSHSAHTSEIYTTWQGNPPCRYGTRHCSPLGSPTPSAWLPRGLQPPYVPVPFLNPPPVHWW
jgi:hypothetical protein